MLPKQTLKKALILSAFFIGLILSPISYAKSCSSSSLSPPQSAIVKWVYDGDTLLLTDKRKIRIIGIDTPEVKHHKQKAQAYGAKAREALRELLKRHAYKITLRFGKERKDKYSRTLAHVFTPDDINVSEWLLEQGFAKTLSFPPNIVLANCYKNAEIKAQNDSLKIWRYKYNQLQNAATLPHAKTGFVRLQGVIKNIKHHRKSLSIELESNSKRPIKIRVKKKNLPYFKTLDLNKLSGQTIEISGILSKRHGKRVIYLNHPSQLRRD